MARTRRMNHEGCIIKRKNGYEYIQMVDGVKRYASARNMEDLKLRIAKIKGTNGAAGKIRVSDWNAKWLEVYVKPLKRKATYEQYKYMVRHIDAAIGKRYMRGITSSDIQLVIAKASAGGASTSTLRHIKKVASCSFKRAQMDKVVAESPVKDVEIPEKAAKPRKTFTPLEVAKLLNAMKKSRWLPSIMFALETGMRKGELLALKWSDIDVKAKTATIDESLDRYAETGDTKNAKTHTIPLSKKAIAALNAQRLILLKEGNKAIHRKADSPQAWVFPNKEGNALLPSSYYTVLARAGKGCGFKASPHMLRHTFVRNSRGVLALKDLQHILGHDESTTTLDIYGDIINEKTSELAGALDSASDKFEQDMATAVDEERNKKRAEEKRVVAFKRT